MIDIVKCLFALVTLLMVFYIWGSGFCRILSVNANLLFEKVLVGFFLYFSVFQFIVLPFILSQGSFRKMSMVWCILVVCITLGGCIYSKRYLLENCDEINNVCLKTTDILLVLFILIVGCMITLNPYFGWDTGYYIGEINEAIYSDTMYVFNGNDGIIEEQLPFRYIFNGAFFMQFAIISLILNISPLTVAFFLMRGLGYILSLMVIFSIGMEWFLKDRRKALYLVSGFVFFNIVWSTSYSTDFFLSRMYEGKGYCQNIVLPMTFFCLIRIYQDLCKKNDWWKILFVVGLASVPLSMSSLLVFPALVGIACLSIWMFNRDEIFILYQGFICTIPNVIYAILYFIEKKGIILISTLGV